MSRNLRSPSFRAVLTSLESRCHSFSTSSTVSATTAAVGTTREAVRAKIAMEDNAVGITQVE
jgi:hypothetical protein